MLLREGNTVAREVYTKLIDDVDGGEAHETVKFGLDGYSYEIDLSTKNANKLRNALAQYIEYGSRVSGRGGSNSSRAVGRARGGVVAEREQNKAIRAWAIRKGLDVAARGRIRSDIIDQYHREAGR
jgi:hypothetical protein